MGQEHKEYTWNLIAKKLTGEASTEELLELEALLRGNPELHYPMQTMADLWKSSSPEDKKMAEQALNRHLDRMEVLNIDFITSTHGTGKGAGPNRSYESEASDSAGRGTYRDPSWPARQGFQRKRILITASILCLLIITGLAIFMRSGTKASLTASIPPAPAEPRSEVFTRNGSRTNLVLPDGTQVWLNAGSRLTYDKNYGTASREVNLTGEAFFDVARNAGKPFVIHAARVDIKVLGTRFNVKSYPSDKTTETTLIRGSIEVSIKDRPSEKIILKPNEKLVVANDDSTLHRNHPSQPAAAINESLVSIRKPTYETATGAVIETSWVDNKLIFQDEEFRDLAKQMERWYGVTFRFTNPIQEGWSFTGNFQKETIQQALDALKLTQAFDYTIEGNQITIYDR
ncbi:MAG TPA: FecR family protein [Puia sp.]|jgi:ferric-dicitrate binding protein FerR (iron transport regulator)|nr:FecR family protein [Puia sp.]